MVVQVVTQELANALAKTVEDAQGRGENAKGEKVTLAWTSDETKKCEAQRFLLLLDSETWASSERRERLCE